jgi:hypothetical protein
LAHVLETRLVSYSRDWETPAEVIEAARASFGGRIDLDPASCERANLTVRADRYIAPPADGLLAPWFGNVWLNPPGKKEGDPRHQPALWWEHLWHEYSERRVTRAAFLIFNLSTLMHTARLACPHPTKFAMVWPLNRLHFSKEGEPKSAPKYENAIVLLGPCELSPWKAIGRVEVP